MGLESVDLVDFDVLADWSEGCAEVVVVVETRG